MEAYKKTSSRLRLLLLALLLSYFYAQQGEATTFTIRNNCGYTIWPASLPAINGGGTTLAPGQTWTVSANTFQGRFWARTGCRFDASGRGPPCATGDCGGVLRCNGAGGVPPTSLAEFALNSWSGLDFYDVSYVDGYDIPVDITPTRGGCPVGGLCHYDLKSRCPGNLQVRGSNGAVVACRQGDGFRPVCKAACRMAYCFDTDDINTLSCAYGTNYNIVFCPAWSSARANVSSEATLAQSS